MSQMNKNKPNDKNIYTDINDDSSSSDYINYDDSDKEENDSDIEENDSDKEENDSDKVENEYDIDNNITLIDNRLCAPIFDNNRIENMNNIYTDKTNAILSNTNNIIITDASIPYTPLDDIQTSIKLINMN